MQGVRLRRVAAVICVAIVASGVAAALASGGAGSLRPVVRRPRQGADAVQAPARSPRRRSPERRGARKLRSSSIRGNRAVAVGTVDAEVRARALQARRPSRSLVLGERQGDDPGEHLADEKIARSRGVCRCDRFPWAHRGGGRSAVTKLYCRADCPRPLQAERSPGPVVRKRRRGENPIQSQVRWRGARAVAIDSRRAHCRRRLRPGRLVEAGTLQAEREAGPVVRRERHGHDPVHRLRRGRVDRDRLAGADRRGWVRQAGLRPRPIRTQRTARPLVRRRRQGQDELPGTGLGGLDCDRLAGPHRGDGGLEGAGQRPPLHGRTLLWRTARWTTRSATAAR